MLQERRRSRLWSKPVNLRTCGLVSDSIAIVQAFAELRYGAVVHTRENSVKYGHNLGQTLYDCDEFLGYIYLSLTNGHVTRERGTRSPFAAPRRTENEDYDVLHPETHPTCLLFLVVPAAAQYKVVTRAERKGHLRFKRRQVHSVDKRRAKLSKEVRKATLSRRLRTV